MLLVDWGRCRKHDRTQSELQVQDEPGSDGGIIVFLPTYVETWSSSRHQYIDWRTLIQRQVLPHAEAVVKVHVIEDYITLYYITYDDVIFCCHRTIHMMMKYLTFFAWALPLKCSTRRSNASGSYLMLLPATFPSLITRLHASHVKELYLRGGASRISV